MKLFKATISEKREARMKCARWCSQAGNNGRKKLHVVGDVAISGVEFLAFHFPEYNDFLKVSHD